MSDDLLRAYRDANTAYVAARTEASAVLRNVIRMGDGLQRSLPVALAWTFKIGAEQGKAPPPYAADLDTWPDAATLKAVVEKWHRAFTELQAAWARVPKDDQAIARPPPTEMRLD